MNGPKPFLFFFFINHRSHWRIQAPFISSLSNKILMITVYLTFSQALWIIVTSVHSDKNTKEVKETATGVR